MIERDYFMRQVHMLAQALAHVLFLKRSQRNPEAVEAAREALQSALGMTPEALRTADRDELTEACMAGSAFIPDKALALAELLTARADLYQEDGDATAEYDLLQRALWLYEAVREHGDVVPLDLYERMGLLRARLIP